MTTNLQIVLANCAMTVEREFRAVFSEAVEKALLPLFDLHRIRGAGDYWDQIQRAVDRAALAAARVRLNDVEFEAERQIAEIASRVAKEGVAK